ncbi:MAG: hypothetical protein ACYDBQ_05350 [Thermoplasmatota archaeon]
MDHTPLTPADERVARWLERVAGPEGHILRGAVARASGVELQAEFGSDHVGLIANHNQFLRVFRSPPAMEFFLDPADREMLAKAGFALGPPEGAVFRLFGWVRVDPTAGPAEALGKAVEQALGKALRGKAAPATHP